jgi:hypothetical protein
MPGRLLFRRETHKNIAIPNVSEIDEFPVIAPKFKVTSADPDEIDKWIAEGRP